MAKILLRSRESLPTQADVAAPDECPDAEVATRVALGQGNPLAVRWHAVPRGASVTWSNSAQGHAIYVWSGKVEVGRLSLDAGSSIIVEHGGSTVVSAGTDGAELLVFNATATSLTKPVGAGGGVHLLPAAEVPRVVHLAGSPTVGGALFADSGCPTCGLWLHESTFHQAGGGTSVHSHSEDEAIVVTGGGMMLGGRLRGRGTVLFVAHDTLYSFKSGEAGLTFINFRPGHPWVRRVTDPAPVDETQFYKTLPRPQYRS